MSFLGILATFLFCFGAAGIGRWIVGRWTEGDDPAARLGVHGLAGLGALGLLTLFVGLLPGGLRWGALLVVGLALAGLVFAGREVVRSRPTLPSGPWRLVPLALTLAALISLVGVLAPSDARDWDTLAYHLAVPKLWLSAGQIHYVSFIHHSNFPATVDDLYAWGLLWGGQSGAKAFSLAYAVYGVFVVFGFARGRYGASAGWWATLAYATIPLVIWEAGTAYIDVANGLFVALGILYAARLVGETPRKADVALAGIFLGLAAGSKYTGLQTVFAVGVVLLGYGLARRTLGASLRNAVVVSALALAIASPWYVKNVVNTGNPVYPFFYSVFKGRNWDAFGDRIYREQQQTFGVGRSTEGNYVANPLEPARIGASVLGLAYQPGRYTDPQPTSGNGFPFQSLGAIPLAAMLVWLFSGRARREEGFILATVLVSLGLWFFLSQQSRYIVGLTFPLCVLAGGAAGDRFDAFFRPVGKLLAGAIVVQALASFWILTRFGGYGDTPPMFVQKLRVVLGTTSVDDALRGSFYEPAGYLNTESKGGRVALFDEVFGFWLDVPYYWANPGHSTEIGYDRLKSGDEFVDALKRLGITHAYLNLGTTFGGDAAERDRWIAAAGLQGPPQPYTGEDRVARMADPRSAYKVLLAEAIASGRMRLLKAFGSRLIFIVE